MKKIYITLLIVIISILLIILSIKIIKNHDYDNTISNHQKSSIPEHWLDNGIFSDYYDKAYSKLKSLTLEEKIGQVFLVRVPIENQIEVIKKYNIGGYILFGRDTKNETKESLVNKINSYQKESKIPLIIAVDEEGGTVVRISSNPNLRDEKFKSPQEIYKDSGFSGIKNTTIEMSKLLDNLGINVNLAPVADISTDETDFIYNRSFGKGVKLTSKYIKTVINSSKDYKVSYVLKHFPGYGNNLDTHVDSSIDNRTLKYLKKNDLVPFQTGIDEGAEAILFSHNIISQIDSKNPASLSSKLHNYLKNEMKFTGIIITDDLDMKAITNYSLNASVKALKAGNDILIISDYEKSYNDIINALEKDLLTEEEIDYHVFRILAWKYYKGLLK